MKWSRVTLAVLVCLLVGTVGLTLFFGWSYYLTPIQERSFHPSNDFFKPSGIVGQKLGIAGGLMMLLTFLYTLRKRSKGLQRIGTQALWLQFHIFLGLGGPVLVTLHTSGKMGGIAAMGYYSAMAVALSGIFGRYLYSKIPRSRKGTELTLKEIEQQMLDWVSELSSAGTGEAFFNALENYLGQIRKRSGGLARTLVSVLSDDLRSPRRMQQAWAIAGLHPCSFRKRLHTARLILRQRRMIKHLAVLEASQRLLSYWHIFHRPFTIMASVLIVLHVAVATYFGYGMAWK